MSAKMQDARASLCARKEREAKEARVRCAKDDVDALLIIFISIIFD